MIPDDAYGGSPPPAPPAAAPAVAPAPAAKAPLKMSDVRSKFPQYADLSDDQLLIGLHKKFYSDMPAAQFYGNIDRDTERASLNAQNTTSGMNAFERGLGAAKTALDRTAYGVKSMLPQSVQDAGDAIDRWAGSGGLQASDVQQGQDFVNKAGTAGKVGQFAGDVLPMLAGGGAATEALSLGTRALPKVAGALVRGAGEVGAGAGMGAVQAMPGQRGQGAAMGALGGAAGVGVNRLIGGAVKPAVTAEAQSLMDQGIQPTVGQSLGGFWNKAEDVASTSLPFIAPARARAVNEFNQAAIQKAAPGVTGMGDDALSAARDAISGQYKDAMARMPQQFSLDTTPLVDAAKNAVNDASLGLTQGAKRDVLDYVQNNLLNRSTNLTPEIAKRIESDMNSAVTRWKSGSTAAERSMGDALDQVHQQWRQSLTDLGNSTGTGAGDALRGADASWRAFRAVDRAGAGAGAQNAETAGMFTPRQLRNAIAAEDKSAMDRATRYGTVNPNTPFGELNSLSRDANAVLPNRVGNSGTQPRQVIPMALAAIGSGSYLGAPGWLGAAAGTGALGAGYSRVGQKLATQGAGSFLPDAAQQAIKPYTHDAANAVLAAARARAIQDAQTNTGAPYAPQQ